MRFARAALAACLALPLLPTSVASAAVPFGSVLHLDGDGDFATAADADSLDLGNEDEEDFAVEAFLYVPDTTSDATQILVHKDGNFQLGVGFNTAMADQVFLSVWYSATDSVGVAAFHDLAAGWHHLAGTFDNAQGTFATLKVLIDGAEVASDTFSVFDLGATVSTSPLAVGAQLFGSSSDFEVVGMIDEVRLSSSVRYVDP